MKVRSHFCALMALTLSLPGFGQAPVNFTSSNLPIVVINTNGQTIVDEPKIPAQMGIIDNGPGIRNQVADPYNNYNGYIGIELRGSSSQSFPKKQYGIELQDALGNGIDKSLLGLPKKDDWILFAAYDDKTLLRDALAYHLGRQLGRYASRSRFVELVLNGEYQGVYVLLEKIKRDKNRVDIAKMDASAVSGDAVTGGYIIKIDKSTGSGGAGWTSSFPPEGGKGWQSIFFQYEYPKQEDITPEQSAYIRQYVYQFEAALHGGQFQDPVNGYARYADRSSFIDYFIMNEVTKNPDGYRLSTFFHKKRDSDGGKLFMGPIWDYNEGFGNVDYCTYGNTDGFVIDFNGICPDDYWQIPFWWKRLLQDSAFRTQLGHRWTSLRAGALATANVLAYVDSVSGVLNAEAQQRNFQQWPILGTYVWPNYFIGATYQQEINWLKDWITYRLEWLDINLRPLVTGIESSRVVLRVFPNPFTTKLSISYDAGGDMPIDVELYDVSGRRVESVTFSARQGIETAEMNLSALPSGVYILKTSHDGHQTVQRVVKMP